MTVNNEKLKMVQFCLFAAFVLDIALMYLVGKNFPMLLESDFFNQFYIIHFIFPSLVAVLILITIIGNWKLKFKRMFNVLPLVFVFLFVLCFQVFFEGSGFSIFLIPFLVYPCIYGIKRDGII